MDTIGFLPLLWWAFVVAVVVGGGIYLFIEYQAYLMRTRVDGIPGGLRFTSRIFVVEARYGAKQLVVQTANGDFRRQPLPKGDETVQLGSLTATLPAAGLTFQVFRMVEKSDDPDAPNETGISNIVFNASDAMTLSAQNQTGGERYVLRLNGVPSMIANDFQRFANGLHTWIDKIESGLKAEIDARRQQEEQEAKAAAAAAKAAAKAGAAGVSNAVLTDEQRQIMVDAQIATWRETAGFKGNASEVSVEPNGVIRWFIDLDPTGRVILSADKRMFHGNLKGATVTSLGGELEISVRDDYWTEQEPQLVVFRILGGASPDVRRAWKERLELVVQSMGKAK